MIRHVEMQHTAAVMRQDDENKQHAEACSRPSKEIHRGHLLHVICREGPPGLRRRTRPPRACPWRIPERRCIEQHIGKQRCAYNRRNIELPPAAWNLILLSRFPQGKAGAGKGSPHAATRSAPANHAGTAHAAAIPARGLSPPCTNPDQSQPMSLSEDDCAWEKIEGGRHTSYQ